MDFRPLEHYSPPRLVATLAAICILLVAAGAAAETPSMPDFSDSQLEDLHDGEVLVDVEQTEDGADRGVIFGIIQEDISDVTPPIARCWEYGEWRENLEDTYFKEKKDDNNIICGGTASVPFPLSDRDGDFHVYNRSETVDGTRAFVSNYEYIEGSGDLEDMFGYWLAYPYGEDDEHTMIKFVLNVDIGTWIPSRIMSWAHERILPGTITMLREKVTDGVQEPLFWNDHDYE